MHCLQLVWPATKKKLQNMPSIFSGKKAMENEESAKDTNQIKMVLTLLQKGASSVR
jgi:hypothetical protein